MSTQTKRPRQVHMGWTNQKFVEQAIPVLYNIDTNVNETEKHQQMISEGYRIIRVENRNLTKVVFYRK